MKKEISKNERQFAALAADTVLFTIKDNVLLVRLINVNRPPYYVNIPGLPGGLLTKEETAGEAAARHLKDKALDGNNTNVYVEQLYTFSSINRDLRNRVVAVAYIALIPWDLLSSSEQQDTEHSFWKQAERVRGLAYDHDEILQVALIRLRSRITYTTLISKLMPNEFTLTELEMAYESILHADLDKRNFRKKIAKLDILKKLPHKRSTERSRPASLYEFKSSKVHEIDMLTKQP